VNEGMGEVENEVAVEKSVKKLREFMNEDEGGENEYSNGVEKGKEIMKGVGSRSLDKGRIEDGLLELENGRES
ncbi:hypothetical protein, partial [Staphylococcus epidermidis]|uniref:hypothetical protein n=1 Tax=Staphylococcus epidermidis TaxID=1282 RepID=UPI0016429A61